MPFELMDSELNLRSSPAFETSATNGDGVFDALKAITKQVLADLKRKGIYQDRSETDASKVAPVPDPVFVPRSDPPVTPTATTDSGAFEAAFGRETDSIEMPAIPGEDSAQTLVNPSAPIKKRRPTGEQSAIVSAISSHIEKETSSTHRVSGGANPTFSGLWKTGPIQDRIMQIEDLVRTGEYEKAVKLSDMALQELVNAESGAERTLSEALLALGVHSSHYVRFQSAISAGDPDRDAALFSLFFLTDVELRFQAAGVHMR
jgi:hypothetical protein